MLSRPIALAAFACLVSGLTCIGTAGCGQRTSSAAAENGPVAQMPQGGIPAAPTDAMLHQGPTPDPAHMSPAAYAAAMNGKRMGLQMEFDMARRQMAQKQNK
jgi:hypothetical protein